ncbi:MAG: right-handed parallel beta-helix repeat-containing protein [Promethearchaeota archaeon]|jgi:hypothetical protein
MSVTWYVKTSGGDDSDYGTTLDTAFATVDKATQVVAAGDSVILAVMGSGQKFNQEPTTGATFSTSGTTGPGVITWSGANVFGEIDGTVAIVDASGMSPTNAVLNVSGNFQIFRYISVEDMPTSLKYAWAISGQALALYRCETHNNKYNQFNITGNNNSLIECVASNSDAGSGFALNADNCLFFGCVAHDNSVTGFLSSHQGLFVYCISYGNNRGFDQPYHLLNCVSYNNSSHGVAYLSLSSDSFDVVENCIFSDNGGWGIDDNWGFPTFSNPKFIYNTAFYNNSADSRNDPIVNGIVKNKISLSADPFIDAPNGNFGLNNDPLGGVLCKQTGTSTLPGVDQGVITSQFVDIGAVQSSLRAIVSG